MIRAPATMPSPQRHPALDVLIVEADGSAASRLAAYLRADGHRPTVVATVAAARAELDRQPADLICLTLDPAAGIGGEAVRQLLTFAPTSDVISVAPGAEAERALQAIHHGAIDHLATPVTPAAVELVLRRVSERRRLASQLRSVRIDLDEDPDADLPTDTAEVHRVLSMARRVAASAAPVLIVGEAGTGKGRLARAIHAWSPRAAGPLAVVSAAGHAADALDADLFGAAGITGAEPHGQVARCRGGTLVIDRVGDLPLSLQPKLLRLITERQYERRDDARARAADVRLVGTTTDELAGAVRAGTFMEILRLALDVVRLELPPLRHRPRDVPLLAERYLNHAARQYGRAVTGFAPAALEVLGRYAWPGNLRELRNVVERTALVAAGDRVEAADLPPDVRGGGGTASHVPGDLVPLRAIEDQHIRRVLAAVGNARAAAAVLGIDPSTLWRRLRTRPED